MTKTLKLTKSIGFTASILCLTVTGCTYNYQPKPYDATHSRAYNIAREGGLYQVKDHRLPKAEYKSLKTAGGLISDTALFSSSFSTGRITSGLGLGLLNIALSDYGQHSKNSIVAWMPRTEAASTKEAQGKMRDLLKVAMEEALNEMSYGYYPIKVDSEYKVQYHFWNDRIGCPKFKQGMSQSKLCYISTRVYEPNETTTPLYIASTTAAYGFKSNNKKAYHRFRILEGKHSNIPTKQIYETVSSKLPKWAYIYVDSGKIPGRDNTILRAPYLLEKGKAQFFVHHNDK